MPKRTSYEPGTPCWVDLASPDLEVAKTYYGGLFGWTAHTCPDPEAGAYTIFTLGNGMEGNEVAGALPIMNEGQPPAWTTYVSVADVDGLVKRVQEAGGQVLTGPADVMEQGRSAMFLDDQGAYLGAWEPRAFPGASIVNDPGAMCWNELACRDIERAKNFYGAVFGWEGRTNSFGESTYTEWYNNGNVVGGMLQMNESRPDQVPPHWMVYFTVENCDASAALAQQLGGTVAVEPIDIPIGRFATLNDPHSAAFSIMQFTMDPNTPH